MDRCEPTLGFMKPKSKNDYCKLQKYYERDMAAIASPLMVLGLLVYACICSGLLLYRELQRINQEPYARRHEQLQHRVDNVLTSRLLERTQASWPASCRKPADHHRGGHDADHLTMHLASIVMNGREQADSWMRVFNSLVAMAWERREETKAGSSVPCQHIHYHVIVDPDLLTSPPLRSLARVEEATTEVALPRTVTIKPGTLTLTFYDSSRFLPLVPDRLRRKNKHYSSTPALLKLFMPTILEHLDRVICLDNDVVILGPGLWDIGRRQPRRRLGCGAGRRVRGCSRVPSCRLATV